MDFGSDASWEAFLDPNQLKPRLLSAAVYIAAYEGLKDIVVSRPHGFFITGFDKSGPIVSGQYTSSVRSRNRSLTFASLD